MTQPENTFSREDISIFDRNKPEREKPKCFAQDKCFTFFSNNNIYSSNKDDVVITEQLHLHVFVWNNKHCVVY
jgi:hypothetical protein